MMPYGWEGNHIDLALHLPCVTDFSGLSTSWLKAYRSTSPTLLGISLYLYSVCILNDPQHIDSDSALRDTSNSHWHGICYFTTGPALVNKAEDTENLRSKDGRH